MYSTISFPNMFESSAGKVSVVSGDLSHKQSLKSLFLTTIGELFGDPQFGCELKSVVFELKSALMQQMLKEALVSAASRYVPQVVIKGIEINITETSDTTVPIVVNYYTINTGENNFIELTVLSDGSITTR